MKRIILVLISFYICSLFSAEFQVLDFQEQLFDTELALNPVIDINGDYAALIKISTDLIPFDFNTNAGVVKTERKVGEFWAYVQPGVRQLIFTKEGYSKERYSIPITIKENTVYTMRLITKVIPPDYILDENLAQITFQLNEMGVFVALDNSAPLEKSEKLIVYKVPKGEHTFRFFKEGFDEVVKTLDVQKDEEITINLEPGFTESRMSLPGFIDISSEPAQAEVYINDQRMGVTPIQINLTAGNHKLTLRKTLYHTYEVNFELMEKESKTLPVIELRPKFGYYAVKTNPAGADIYLDNKSIGKSPIPRREIESGTHELRAEYNMYHTDTRELIIADGDDKEINIPLKPAFGELIINSQPEQGATVYIEGDEVGVTPYRNPQQRSGPYRVRIDKAMWLGSEEQVTVYDEQKTEKTLLLTRNFATLTVNAPEAKIFLNNKPVSTGYYSEKLEKGTYNVRAEKDRHHPDEEDVYISPGNDRSIELNPVPMLGSLSVKSNPYDSKGAEIWLNDKKQKETTPAVLELLIGKYDVTLKHNKFLEQSKTINIEENKQQNLEFNLQTLKGSMLAKANKWKWNKWLGLAGALLIAGGGVYCNSMGDGYYDDYKASITTEDAISNRDNTEKWYNYRDYAYYVSVGPAIWFVYSWIKEAGYRGRIDEGK
ncbi:MAG: PEGA domain-containing protein [Candidatus Cloacimonetes bacterium]|nr:PEGA domain-containing protein [Candidatus Cloacimonadota bacterium]